MLEVALDLDLESSQLLAPSRFPSRAPAAKIEIQTTEPNGKYDSSYTDGKVVWRTKLGTDTEAMGTTTSSAPELKPRSQITTHLLSQPQAAKFELGRVQVCTSAWQQRAGALPFPSLARLRDSLGEDNLLPLLGTSWSCICLSHFSGNMWWRNGILTLISEIPHHPRQRPHRCFINVLMISCRLLHQCAQIRGVRYASRTRGCGVAGRAIGREG